jgi:hypothetical protein
VIELLRPQHARQCLTLHQPGIGIGDVALQLGVELVRLGAALRKNVIKPLEAGYSVTPCKPRA